VEGYFYVSTLSLIFEQGVDSDKYSGGLVRYNFYIISSCSFSIENHTEILYLVDKGFVRSFRCEMRLPVHFHERNK
jgi:hypothetical protein